MNTFAYPFRFVNGRVAQMDIDSDAARAQLVAAALKTGIGEMVLQPSFGTRTDAFDGMDTSGFLYSVNTFLRDHVQIASINERVNPETGAVEIAIEFFGTE